MTDSSPSRSIELLLGRQLPAGAEADLVSFFGRFGTVTEPRRPLSQRGPALDFLVLAAVPLQAFLTSFGKSAGTDAYNAFKNVFKKIWHHESHTHASNTTDPAIVLQDINSGLQVVIQSGLPEIAFQQLLELDLHQFSAARVIFDRDLGCWRADDSEAATP